MSFIKAFSEKISASLNNNYGDNFDYYRFNTLSNKAQYRLSNLVYRILGRFFVKRNIPGKIAGLLGDYSELLEKVYASYENDNSRKWMVDLLAFYTMGFRYVKLDRNSGDYWQTLREIGAIADKRKWIPGATAGERLRLYDLERIEFPARVYLSDLCVLREFIFKQYEYISHDIKIKAEPGDVVIDAGACWGDTALYFANEVGETGRVYSFEFLPANLEILGRNMAMNKELSRRIEIVEHPVWSVTGESVGYTDTGSGNKVVLGESDFQKTVETLSIDDLSESKGLRKVDFIKMDIEGAELPALEGAVKTLKKHRPKLAIAIYHSIDDFLRIPEFIKNLDLGYKIYLNHYTIHWEETILYAVAD